LTARHVPLHVFQVLEEECANLYGQTPAGEVAEVWLPERGGGAMRPGAADVELKGVRLRPVEAARDWRFRRGHLTDPAGLAAEVLRADAPGAAAAGRPDHLYEEWARTNLRKYLRGRLDNEALGRVEEASRAAGSAPEAFAAAEAELREELDKLLEYKGLYDADRFPQGWMTPMVQGLAELHARGGGLEGEDLAQLNRLLVESAFPRHVERIHHIRIAAVYQRLHAEGPNAMCLSGGGIRSGTFALGVLQGFARHDLLKEFDYLSTVSGGGYIGSWLTAWLHRHPEGLAGVTRGLANRAPVSKVDPDPRPVRHLREFSSFLTPKAGALTADTWAFVAIYLRNLLLNWAVILPLLVGALTLPRLLVALTMMQPTDESRPVAVGPQAVTPTDGRRQPDETPAPLRVEYEALTLSELLRGGGAEAAAPAGENAARAFLSAAAGRDSFTLYPRHLLLAAGFLLGVWAVGYVGFNRPGVRETLRKRSRFWRERSDQRSFLKFCLLPLVASASLLTTYWAWSQEAAKAPKSAGFFAAYGLLFAFCGWLVSSLVLRRLWRLREISWAEFFSVLGGALLGGLLFFLIAQLPIGDPVVGYGVREQGGRVVSSPLAWTDPAGWTWLDWRTELYVCLAVPGFLIVLWAATTLFVGTTSFSSKITDEDREWWARFGAWLLIAALGWVAVCGVVIFGPLLLLEFPRLLGAVGSLSGLVAVLLGRSALTPARDKGADETDRSKAGAASGLVAKALPLLGLVFLASFVAAVSLLTTGVTRGLALQAASWSRGETGLGTRLNTELLTNVPAEAPYNGFGGDVAPPPPNSYLSYITPVAPRPARADGEDSTNLYAGAQVVHLNVLHHTSAAFHLLIALSTLLAGVVFSRLINLNYFSLHGGYRNRLIRAFLGASRPPGQRQPNPFTGFDPADNIHMHELRPALLDEDDILDAGALADALLDQTRPLSRHLGERDLLPNVVNQPGTTASPGLVAALRTDLNAVLEAESLFEQDFARALLDAPHARRVLEAVNEEMRARGVGDGAAPRGDYRILLNRLVLEGAYPGALRPGQYPPPPYRLLHVINTTLNLVGGEKLAWQQRKAEPFSVSPLHAGCFRLGYRRSRDYGGRETGGISIGTAAAISGAAASSNMGYYTTSPIISLLLTLFNVRLGWWLGNPGPAGQKTYQLNSPKFSVAPVFYEAFGMTNDRYEYVYLTDGGHFENLALYEMVLRRARLIVVSDGAQDGEYRFGDLGNAVRKIRIDLGVPIEFPRMDIRGWDEEKKDGRKGAYWAVGRIRYSCVDTVAAPKTGVAGETGGAAAPAWPRTAPAEAADGVLIYIKPALYGDEPRDVLEYRENFPAFPHQSTGDQFFDEPQFESYRALGSFIADRLCGSGFDPLTIEQLIERARPAE
jgi:hypothetical protein